MSATVTYQVKQRPERHGIIIIIYIIINIIITIIIIIIM